MAAFQNIILEELPQRIRSDLHCHQSRGNELGNISEDIIRMSIREVFGEYIPGLMSPGKEREERPAASNASPAERFQASSGSIQPLSSAPPSHSVAADDRFTLSPGPPMPLALENISYTTVAQAPTTALPLSQSTSGTMTSSFNFNYSDQFQCPTSQSRAICFRRMATLSRLTERTASKPVQTANFMIIWDGMGFQVSSRPVEQ